MAAGLSMPTEHIAEFRKQINEFAASLPTDISSNHTSGL